MFFQNLLETFVDGIVVVTAQGKGVFTNAQAIALGRNLLAARSQPHTIPQLLWQVLQATVENQPPALPLNLTTLPDQSVFLGAADSFRVRTRWIELAGVEAETVTGQVGSSNGSCLLMVLEDLKQASRNAAIADIHQYHLSDREAEVWLQRKQGYSYQDIASRLYISVNTVKKHLSSIRVKQSLVQAAQENAS